MVQTPSKPPTPKPGNNKPGDNKFRGRVFRAQPKRFVETPQQVSSVKTYSTSSGDKLRIMVLGGCEEVGRNCTLLEYKDDIVIVDMGLQFPEENMPGVDYIIPNMTYLKGKEKKFAA
jgi:ribonuclease J